jgi:alpha,alpha-trehalose phosphorylase
VTPWSGSRAGRLRKASEERRRRTPSERVFPIDPWRIVERRFSAELVPQLESIFAVANGYLGLRGGHEEGTPVREPGTMVNGLYESWPIVYPEDSYGLARTGQTIVDATDGAIIRLFVEEEPFDLAKADIVHYERVLDLRTATLTRTVEWRTPRRQRIVVRSRRLVSLQRRHLAVIHYEVEAPEDTLHVAVSSELVTHGPGNASDDPRVGRGFTTKVLVPEWTEADGAAAALGLRTRSSGLSLAVGMDHEIGAECATSIEASAQGDGARVVILADLEPGRTLAVTKFLAYHYDADPPAGDLNGRVHRTLRRARLDGLEAIEASQRTHVDNFWAASDVELEGAPALQQAARFDIFQLLQATHRAEGHGVPAKGLTGRGYEGHYFWDTEIFVVPFLVHTDPQVARQVLDFRCSLLDAARRRAREVGHRGALFPWRTINGDEASANYASGTAQYHIDADVAYSLSWYLHVTGDEALMLEAGAEVMIETARLWVDLGFFSERGDGKFVINGVTGPDEYSTVVDNNAYTNLMARENLRSAVRAVEWLGAEHPERYAPLIRRLGLADEEVATWRRAAELMHIPYADDVGVLQDEDFLVRERWPFETTPPENYPLLLHYHPLELYRHQVIKQADVVLAAYLAGRAVTAAEKRKVFEYYDPLTTGDSTLSACIQCVVATEIDDPDTAYEYFLHAVNIDLADIHQNTKDGIHIASCGGTWLTLVAGFGGLRDHDGRVMLRPRLPRQWERLRFRLRVRDGAFEVDMARDRTTYTLLEGDGLTIHHEERELRLVPGEPCSEPAAPAEPASAAVTGS